MLMQEQIEGMIMQWYVTWGERNKVWQGQNVVTLEVTKGSIIGLTHHNTGTRLIMLMPQWVMTKNSVLLF